MEEKKGPTKSVIYYYGSVIITMILLNALFVPLFNKSQITNVDYGIFNKITTITGGRAAEEIVFGQITTGAANDIEQATRLARAMVTRFGMSDNYDMMALETGTNQYLGGDASLMCSAETAARIDNEVLSIIKDAHSKATKILIENRKLLDDLSKYLIDKETITGEEFKIIVNNEG